MTDTLFGDAVLKTASISLDGVYRYRLTRSWAEDRHVVWVMLNPSTADAEVDDPTIRRCMGFARAWGYGGIVVVNLFALRATDPKALVGHPAPFGSDNLSYVHDAIADNDVTVAAWGAHPFTRSAVDGVQKVAAKLHKPLWCVGKTKDGHPRHPLYVKGDKALEVWRA